MNDGTVASGEETRSVDLLAGYLAGAGDHEVFEPQPGRTSLVARIEGTDPDAPSLLLMGHTDVVPVNPDGWSRDPFGAEIVDGFVWGRGAVDMLNLTASQAVAFRRLADSGFRPKGTLIYLAVADEEALGTWGARLAARPRARRGVRRLRAHRVGRVPDADARTAPRLPVLVGEKGTFWSKLTVHGTPGHGSQPFRTDNALVTAAEVVRRIAEYQPADPDPRRRGASSSRAWASIPRSPPRCSTPTSFTGALAELPLGMARHVARVHAHHVRADGRARRHQDERDPRPGRSRGRHPHAARARRAPTRPRCCARRSAISPTRSRSSRTTIPRPRRRSTRRCGTRWRASSARLCEGSALVPSLMVGGTDNRFFRRAGAVGYGFGLFSQRLAVRGLRHDVPRQRRARRPGVARAVDAAVGSRRPRLSSADVVERQTAGRAAASSVRSTARYAGARPHEEQHRHEHASGPTPRWKRAAVDASGGGDRADHVEREDQRGGAGEAARRRAAAPHDELDDADEVRSRRRAHGTP